MVSTGQEALIDVYKVPFGIIDDIEFWLVVGHKLAEKAKTKIVDEIIKRFDPFGFSLAIVISESHITIHTFPEKEFVAFNFYSCGKKENFLKAINWLEKELKRRIPTAEIEIKYVERGRKCP